MKASTLLFQGRAGQAVQPLSALLEDLVVPRSRIRRMESLFLHLFFQTTLDESLEVFDIGLGEFREWWQFLVLLRTILRLFSDGAEVQGLAWSCLKHRRGPVDVVEETH